MQSTWNPRFFSRVDHSARERKREVGGEGGGGGVKENVGWRCGDKRRRGWLKGPITEEKDKLPRLLTCREKVHPRRRNGPRARARTHAQRHRHRYIYTGGQVDRLQRERLHPVAVPRRLRAGCIPPVPPSLHLDPSRFLCSALCSARFFLFSAFSSLLSLASVLSYGSSSRSYDPGVCTHPARVHFCYRQWLRYHHWYSIGSISGGSTTSISTGIGTGTSSSSSGLRSVSHPLAAPFRAPEQPRTVTSHRCPA